jgi:uncharacterized protein (TIGR03435 family)
MQYSKICLFCFALGFTAAFAQTRPAFEVATVKPSPPPDMAKLRAAMQAGGRMPFGPHIETGRAEYTFMTLRSLIQLAYGVRDDQITGPDWMENAAFDIVAKMPEGASKDDAPRMLQSLLEDRFRLAVHRSSAERTVLALVVGKSGLKMKPSAGVPAAEGAPLKPGETAIDMAGGVRMVVNAATGGTGFDMGPRGKMSMTMNPATRAMHIDFAAMTMGGLADWLTERSTNNDGAEVVDMTGIQGNYDASIDEEPLTAESAADPALDSGGGPSPRMNAEVQALGLKLESRKAMVEKLIIDHVEKVPTDN